MPAIEYFCTYAAFGVLFDFFLQVGMQRVRTLGVSSVCAALVHGLYRLFVLEHATGRGGQSGLVLLVEASRPRPDLLHQEERKANRCPFCSKHLNSMCRTMRSLTLTSCACWIASWASTCPSTCCTLSARCGIACLLACLLSCLLAAPYQPHSACPSRLSY